MVLPLALLTSDTTRNFKIHALHLVPWVFITAQPVFPPHIQAFFQHVQGATFPLSKTVSSCLHALNFTGTLFSQGNATFNSFSKIHPAPKESIHLDSKVSTQNVAGAVPPAVLRDSQSEFPNNQATVCEEIPNRSKVLKESLLGCCIQDLLDL